MDDEQFKVSKDLLKTVTVDTRVDILKALENRPMTASELSRFLDRHVTTVSEHLDLLKNSSLVERVERPGRKWIYYKLTKEGKKILHPESYKWVMVLSTIFIIFVGGLFVWNVDALPGQPFYAIKRARENLQLAFASTSLNRAEARIDMAEERLNEAKAISGMSSKDEMKKLIGEYKNDILDAKKDIEKSMNENMNAISALETLSEVTPKHVMMLQHLAEKHPEIEDDVNTALNASIESQELAISALANTTGMKSVSMPTMTSR